MSINESKSARFGQLFRLVASHSGLYAKWYKPEDWEESGAASAWELKCKAYEKQSACHHLKGSYTNFVKDYAVVTHIFIDGKARIKCMLCGLEAWSHSGEEFKFSYMLNMAQQSTNTPSSSERRRDAPIADPRVLALAKLEM